MIEARPRDDALTARLADKAERLAAALAESALRARRHDPARWRKAALLWPLFGSKL